MIIKTIKSKKSQRLSKLISDELNINFNQIQKLIRGKDIKIDGKRISKDCDLIQGNLVEIYLKENSLNIIFENDDIVVVFKPRNLETLNEIGDDLKTKLTQQLGIDLFAVHRLDRNTQGLVIFAKNIKAKNSLDISIKKRTLEKFYLAKVVGVPEIKESKLLAYLKKDENNSFVYVSDKKLDGYDEIRTNYRLLGNDNEFSILEVELLTGKTHQIRAHLSHIGYPILGDEKYGNTEINKKYKKKFQCLCAYKLIFHFEENDYLSYLKGVTVELEKNEIDFLKND